MPDALIVALAVLAYGVLHSLLASKAAKDGLRRRLGSRMNRYYRLGYNSFALISFLPVLALLVSRPGPILYTLDLPWSAIAVIGQALSAFLLTVGFLQGDPRSFLGLRQLAGEREETHRLTVHGLHRWVRHPLYSAGLALIWLTPVMTSGVLALNLVLTLYVLIGSRLEERRLVAEFGEPYREYQRRVPSLLPLRIPPPR